MKSNMKINTRWIITLALVLLMSTMASAAIQVTENEVLLKVDYKDFDEDDDTIAVATGQFTITNNGASSVTARITVGGLPADYTYTSKDVTVPANGSLQETLTINVPHDKDAGEETIGTITVSEVGGSSTDTISIKQKTLLMLVIDEIEARYYDEDQDIHTEDFDYDRDNPGSKDWDFDNEVLVGTEVELTFKFENLFDNKYDDGDIDNIELTVEASDNDVFAEDIDEQYDLEDIDADGNSELVIKFTIAYDADPDEYSLDITLEGEDQAGMRHKTEKEMRFDVTRKKDDVRIIKAEVVEETVTACDSTFGFDARLENLGTDDHDDVSFVIYNKAFNINQNIPNINLEEYSDRDHTWNKIFRFDLNDVDPGIYQLDVKAYVDQDNEADSKLVSVNVQPCGSTAQNVETDHDTEFSDEGVGEEDETAADETDGEESQQTTGNIPVTGTTAQDNGAAETKPSGSSLPIIQTVENSFDSDNFMVAGIVVLIVLLAGIVVLFVAVLMKR